jgi:hypothetical protein
MGFDHHLQVETPLAVADVSFVDPTRPVKVCLSHPIKVACLMGYQKGHADLVACLAVYIASVPPQAGCFEGQACLGIL